MLQYQLGLSQHAILVTRSSIPWSAIDLVYVIPPDRSGVRWVLCSFRLIERKILGHTFRTTGSNVESCPAGKDFFIHAGTGKECGWRNCSTCMAVNPKGSTCCLNCRVWFALGPIAKLSKMALSSDGRGNDADSSRQTNPVLLIKGLTRADAIAKSLRAGSTQHRMDSGLAQRFRRPCGHLWHLWGFMIGILKWRVKFDGMTTEDQQAPHL